MDHFTIASCVTTCLVIFTIFSIILKLGPRRHLCKQASKFPGPPTLPIIGNAHLFIGSSEAILDKSVQLIKQYPSPFRLWLGNYLLIYISTPEQLKVLLNSAKTIDKGAFYDFAQPLLGTGLATASGAKWRVHRKLIQPTFGVSILEPFVEIFSAQSMITVEDMNRHLDGTEFNVCDYTSWYALHTICETSMGVNLGAQANGDDLYAETVKKAATNVFRRMFSPWLHPDFIFYRTQLGKDQEKNIKFLHAFTNSVIQTKKKELLERSHRPAFADNEGDTSDRVPRRKVFLDHLLELSHDSKILSDEELREEVDTMTVAGTDTVAATSSFAMLMLASHPEIQDKVHRELCEIYGDHDSEELQVTPADLTRMTYLDRVIKETLRIFPVLPFIMRLVKDDLDIALNSLMWQFIGDVIGGHTLPADSLVAIPIIRLHRNGDIWPDPLRFDPDRFLPEEVEKRDQYTYLPFSGGPRGCIGSKYAMMSMKVLLATILRKYVLKKDNITSVKDIRVKWEVDLRPVDPITVRIERRSRNVVASI